MYESAVSKAGRIVVYGTSAIAEPSLGSGTPRDGWNGAGRERLSQDTFESLCYRRGPLVCEALSQMMLSGLEDG